MKFFSETDFLSPWDPGFLALALYAFMVFALVAVLLFLSAWVGSEKPDFEKSKPYESGITPTGSARLRYPVPFYLMAVFFLIFEVEAIYIFLWAAAAEPLGWAGWLQITFFILVLMASLFYLWGKGGLEWGPTRPRSPNSTKT